MEKKTENEKLKVESWKLGKMAHEVRRKGCSHTAKPRTGDKKPSVIPTGGFLLFFVRLTAP